MVYEPESSRVGVFTHEETPLLAHRFLSSSTFIMAAEVEHSLNILIAGENEGNHAEQLLERVVMLCRGEKVKRHGESDYERVRIAFPSCSIIADWNAGPDTRSFSLQPSDNNAV